VKYDKLDQIMDVVRNGLLVMQYHANKIDEERRKMFKLLGEVDDAANATKDGDKLGSDKGGAAG